MAWSLLMGSRVATQAEEGEDEEGEEEEGEDEEGEEEEEEVFCEQRPKKSPRRGLA